MKTILLCADDYGQNTSISQAIINLIEKKRLIAISCLTNTPSWLEAASVLLQCDDAKKCDIGLHFNLTEGCSLLSGRAFYSLKSLLIRSLSRRLQIDVIEAECHAQLDQFVAGLGRLPDFIDGHQHVHQLPVVRDALLKVYQARLRSSGVYIRSTYQPKLPVAVMSSGYSKRWVIQLLGGWSFHRLLKKNLIPHNNAFAGIYDFKKASNFRNYFIQFLKSASSGCLIMCHPGLISGEPTHDIIREARLIEYNYFSSDQFLLDLRENKCVLTRFDHKNQLNY